MISFPRETELLPRLCMLPRASFLSAAFAFSPLHFWILPFHLSCQYFHHKTDCSLHLCLCAPSLLFSLLHLTACTDRSMGYHAAPLACFFDKPVSSSLSALSEHHIVHCCLCASPLEQLILFHMISQARKPSSLAMPSITSVLEMRRLEHLSTDRVCALVC